MKDFSYNIREWQLDWKKEMTKKDNEFVELYVQEHSDWTKEQRMDFLYQGWNRELQEVVKGLRLALECDGKIYQWFVKVIMQQNVIPAQKKIRKIRREISLWENPKLIELGRLSAEDIERAKEFPCKELVEVVRNENGRAWALCPFHKEKTPSFCCYEESNRFYCFGCGKSGDVIQLVMDLYNLEFIDAVNFILRK